MYAQAQKQFFQQFNLGYQPMKLNQLMKQINLKTRNREHQTNLIEKNLTESREINENNNLLQSEFLLSGIDNLIRKGVDINKGSAIKLNKIENIGLGGGNHRKNSIPTMNEIISLSRIARASPGSNQQQNILINLNHHNRVLQHHIHLKKLVLNTQQKLQKINSGEIIVQKSSKQKLVKQQNKNITIINDLIETTTTNKNNNKVPMKITQFDFGLQKKNSQCSKENPKSNQREKRRSISQMNSTKLIESNQNQTELDQVNIEKIKIKNEARLSEFSRHKFVQKIFNLQYLKKKIKRKYSNENPNQNSEQIDQKNIDKRKPKIQFKTKKNKTEYVFDQKKQSKQYQQTNNNLLTKYNSENENYRMMNLKGNSIFTKISKKSKNVEEQFNTTTCNKESRRVFKFRNTGISFKMSKQNSLMKQKYNNNRLEEKITPWKINSNEDQEGLLYNF